MVALDVLRVVFARAVDLRREAPFVGTPSVCGIAREAEGLEHRLQLHTDLVCAPTTDLRPYFPAAVIEGVPEPARLLLLPDKAPHFVHFSCIHALQDDLDLARGQAGNEGTIHQ
jgi:hypothetical protein